MSAAPTQPIMGPWTITYSNAGINQINTTFYYEDQMVHWLADYGLPLVNVTLATIDSSNWWNTACTINYAAQAGGCGVMFFVVLALSQASKRRTPIFILNVLSLLFGFFRGLFLALYFVSPWVKLYPSFTNDYSAIPTNAYVISIFGTLFPFLMSITVSLSLVLQVYTVIKNMKDAYRYGIIAMSGLVFFLAVGFAFARMVINNIDVMHANWYTEQWVMQGALYTETISIWYFSIIFTSKLVYTLHFRRKHGWKQWSGVKILAAMGGCTMVIPSIFAILQYLEQQIGGTFPVAGTISLTMTALLLPLSSLWASMAIDKESANLDISLFTGFNKSLGSSNGSNSSGTSSCCSQCQRSKQSMPCARRVEYADYEQDDVDGDFCTSTIKNKVECSERPGRDSTDPDLEAIGVRVHKSYSLQSAKEDKILSK